MGPIDGTVVPCAAGGSLPFLPAATMRVLNTIHDHYSGAWCRYGFVDAFNPLTDWYDTDVIGIDTGHHHADGGESRSGFVWETFMKNPRRSGACSWPVQEILSWRGTGRRGRIRQPAEPPLHRKIGSKSAPPVLFTACLPDRERKTRRCPLREIC